MGSRRRKSGSRKKKVLLWIGGIILGIILIMGGVVAYYWNKAGDTLTAIHDPLERDQDPARQKELNDLFKNKDSINVLLLGVDARDNDKGRSDTMIIMTLNPKTKSTLMVSIPRDTYVNIPGRGMDKINHAYAFGDVPLSIETVEDNFDVPIHFYVRVNMEGFEEGIDTLGGVTVQNDLDFSVGNKHFAKGPISLNGKEALSYTRMRKQDPRGDFGRNDRQRKVIEAAMKEGANFSSITKVGNFLDIAGSSVKTNMNQDNLESLFKNYRQTVAQNESIEIEGNGKKIDGIWYYIVSDQEFKNLHDTITEHMKK